MKLMAFTNVGLFNHTGKRLIFDDDCFFIRPDKT